MLFPTLTFAVFFAIVFAGHWWLIGRPTARKWFLLAASYVFYGWWDWRFLGLIAGSSVVNHAIARALARSPSPGRRRAWVALATAANLLALGFFKYYGFFVVNAYALCARLGWPCSLPLLDVVLPVGISFFTFQAMSYVFDVAAGRIPPAASLLDFALYLAFFPQLVAGPIVRARDLLPQIESPPTAERLDVGRAVVLIVGGLFKKVVIANWLGVLLVDPVYDHPEMFGRWDALAAVYGYAVQLYCDFSAYSDIAIGVAKLLGFEFPGNFDAPYLSSSVQEFWRRWHISLSTWLRDYLYVPLGGSRRGFGRTALSLMATFLLGGLWHGAGWNFVLWGALHGAYLIVERAVWARRGGAAKAVARLPLGARLALTVLTFHLVGVTYVFFRARSLDDAVALLGAFARGGEPLRVTVPIAVTMAVGFAMQWLDGRRADGLARRAATLAPAVAGVIAALLITMIFALGPRGVAPFIYFQF
ncbi:MAG: MBOAT family protein [Kiritimatiellae bacterium]|nr:MBOAT family protein [Kiritimatiellia bacterium]